MKNYYIRQNSSKFIRKNSLTAILIGCLAIIVGLAVTFGTVLPNRANGQALKPDNSTTSGVNSNDSSKINVSPRAATASYADVVEQASPAVVTIRSDIKTKTGGQDMSPFLNDPMFREFFGGKMPQMKPQPRTEHALGSGVIVGADGTILTNNHVVDGAEKIQVELLNRKSYDAKVIGTDPLSDLAVLKIDATNLPTLPLGDSDKVRVGDIVLAIGNPLGLRQTVTSGIISAKGRATGISDGSFEDFLQTDAPINHGNSGGALVDVDGELIGINSQILSPSGGSIGIGFAIPSNMAKSVMNQLIKNGKVERGMLGVGIQNLNSDLAQSFGVKDLNGVLINSVKAGSPADKAGIKQGDVITAIGGAKVSDTNELRNRVAGTAPGTEIGVTVSRNGSEQNINVKLAEFSPEKTAANDNGENNPGDSNDSPASGKLGVSIQPLTPQVANQLGLKNVSQGLVITDVQAGGKAEDAGLQQGDVILQINRQNVNNLNDVKTALAKSGEKPALLLINRQNQTIYITV